MIKLTKTAWTTYLALIVANLLIFFSALQLLNYFANNRNLPIPPDVIRNLTSLVNKLQKNPEELWPNILQNNRSSSNISLSPKPLYPQNAFLKLNPMLVFNLLKQQQIIEISVFVHKDAWLNVRLLPHFPGRPYLLISIAIVLLLAFLSINYLLVKTLNRPIETIIESLEDTELQENWTPIPLTGSIDQQTILKKINTLQKKVHKLLANRTQVVAAISHDLRTPLTRLKLRAENLPETKNSQKIINDINDMEMMIRDTLDYFQDIHHMEQLQSFDLIAMLNSIKEDAEEVGENVSFTTEHEKIICAGIVNLLKRALTNIINNAIYYGGAAAISLKQTPQIIEISISDKGPGLPENEISKVFSPFYRGEKSRSRSTGGTGLGLTIAKEIIEMHNGFITINNLQEDGLKVIIQLPQ